MSRSAPTLAGLLEGAPLVVCLGPGGVGKTTLSATLALHQAAAGHRALVLTIDPARRLADALSLPGLTNDPVEIHSFSKMHPAGTLSALMLDPSATFDHLIALLVSDPVRRQGLLDNHLYKQMSRTFAGTLEYMAVERLYQLTTSGAYTSLVLDTPPTTNAIDFLQAPERLASFFSEKVTRWFLPQSTGQKASLTTRLFHRAGSSALSLLGKIGGDSFASDVSSFFTAFGDLLGHFRERGESVAKVLRDPRTAYVIVCSPDPNRLAEAKEIDRRLAENGNRAQAFIVNRVDAPFVPDPAGLDSTLERATTLLGDSADPGRVRSFIERLEAVRQTYDSAAAIHSRTVEELRAWAAPRPVFVAPGVPPGESPRAALLAVYVGLFAEEIEAAAS